MEILCHDIKTERKEVSGGLPSYLKIIPILFYLTVVVCSLGYAWFELSRSAGERELDKWKGLEAQHNSAAKNIDGQRQVVEADNEWAKHLADWLEGAHNLQPLVVELGRGVGSEASIAEALMSRNSEIPSQIHLELKLDGVTTQVLDRTLERVRQLNFRAYSAQQQKDQEALDYNATLVYQQVSGIASR